MDSGFSYEGIAPYEVGQELFKYIIDLKFKGVLSARNACLLVFWESMVGATGAVIKLGIQKSLTNHLGNIQIILITS